jgi:hypothetical protein
MTRRFPAGQTRKLAVEITRSIHRALRVHLIHTDQTMIELMDAAGHRYLNWLDSGGIPDRRLFAIHPIRISVGILLPMHRRLTMAALRHRTSAGVLMRDAVARFCNDEGFAVDLTRRDSLRLPLTTISPGDPDE